MVPISAASIPPAGAPPAADAGIRVRVIEYRLEGVEGAEPSYRLLTTILDPGAAPAEELAALYHERWEIEGALRRTEDPSAGSANRPAQQDPGPGAAGILRAVVGAFRGARVDARSRPASRQKIRTGSLSCMRCESFVASCPSPRLFPPRRRKAFHEALLQEILAERVVSSRGLSRPRGVRRPQSKFPVRRRQRLSRERIEIERCIRIIK